MSDFIIGGEAYPNLGTPKFKELQKTTGFKDIQSVKTDQGPFGPDDTPSTSRSTLTPIPDSNGKPIFNSLSFLPGSNPTMQRVKTDDGSNGTLIQAKAMKMDEWGDNGATHEFDKMFFPDVDINGDNTPDMQIINGIDLNNQDDNTDPELKVEDITKALKDFKEGSEPISLEKLASPPDDKIGQDLKSEGATDAPKVGSVSAAPVKPVIPQNN